MADGSDELDRLASQVRAPRAAAFAGMVFSAVFIVAVSLFRSSIPVDPDDPGRWLATSAQRTRVEIALALLPFAGIAFLWFIGVVREHLGDREDRFFATVFLGSGLLFVAMLFVCGAVMAALVGMAAHGGVADGVWRFGRRLVFVVMNTYALRMAAVFAIAATTLSRRSGVLPGWLVLAGYLSALALLVAASSVPWLELVFPLWVLLVSIRILVAGGTGRDPDGHTGRAPA